MFFDIYVNKWVYGTILLKNLSAYDIIKRIEQGMEETAK